MDKSAMVEALVEAYAEGNKSEFARLLNVRPQTIQAWISRNTFDAELIYAKCLNISADWLLTGEGDMLRSSDRLSTAVSISSSSEWIDYLREKDADLRAAREELDSLREKVSELEHLLMEKGTAAGGAPLADIAPAI